MKKREEESWCGAAYSIVSLRNVGQDLQGAQTNHQENSVSPRKEPALVSPLLLLLLSHFVVSDSVRPHRRQPTRLPRPWDSPGKNTGVGCHFLLQRMKVKSESEVAQSCPTSRPHGLQPTRLLCPWDFPGKSTGVGCHCLLQVSLLSSILAGLLTYKCPRWRLLVNHPTSRWKSVRPVFMVSTPSFGKGTASALRYKTKLGKG